jgi:hypothetical protein
VRLLLCKEGGPEKNRMAMVSERKKTISGRSERLWLVDFFDW